MLPSLYFTKATVGCKLSVSHAERRLSYSLDVASHLSPHVLAPPRADHDNVVTIRGRYLGTLPGCELRELITNCLSFVRTIPWSLIGLIRRTAAMWAVNLVIRVATSGAIQSAAMKARSRQRTWDRSNREPATRRKGVSHSLNWFLESFMDFFWFYVDWTKRDHLIFYFYILREGRSFLVSLWMCWLMVKLTLT